MSFINYIDNQLLVGEIEFLNNNKVYEILATDPQASVRDALEHPEFNIKTDIFNNDLLNKIPHFNNYIISHNLKDVIVVFL